MKARLYTDGAARGNPGPAGAGVLLVNSQGRPVGRATLYLGQATNNQAEYRALLLGLALAQAAGVTDLEILLDSELVVRQLTGRYAVRSPDLQPLWQRVQEALRAFQTVRITHVAREANREADRLANRAIDEALGPGPAPGST